MVWCSFRYSQIASYGAGKKALPGVAAPLKQEEAKHPQPAQEKEDDDDDDVDLFGSDEEEVI